MLIFQVVFNVTLWTERCSENIVREQDVWFSRGLSLVLRQQNLLRGVSDRDQRRKCCVSLPEVQEVSQSQTWLPSFHRHPWTARLCCHKTNLSLSSRCESLLVKFIFVAHFQERQRSWTNVSSRHKNQQTDAYIYKHTKQYSRTYTGVIFFISFRTAVVLRMSRSCWCWQWNPLPHKILQHHCLIVQG